MFCKYMEHIKELIKTRDELTRNFSFSISEELTYCEKEIKSLLKNIPNPSDSVWTVTTINYYGKNILEYRCNRCGYSFGSEHVLYDKNSDMYEMILETAVSKQKEHEHIICDPEHAVWA